MATPVVRALASHFGALGSVSCPAFAFCRCFPLICAMEIGSIRGMDL